MSKSLANFTNPTLILPALHGKNAAAVVEELAGTLHHAARVADLHSFCSAVIKRESLVSTETENGIALPHARIAGLKQLSFALGRSKEGLRWSPSAVRSVRLVFLIAAPADDSQQYLLLVSGLARLTKAPDLMERLYAVSDASEMFAVLEQIELRTNPTSSRPATVQR